MSDERPAKRIRQACDPCRRKKSKCSGERPVCSTCWRLEQQCFYNGKPLQAAYDSVIDTQSTSVAHYTPGPARLACSSRSLDGRMAALESTVNKIVDTLHTNDVYNRISECYQSSPGARSTHDSIVETPVPPLTAIIDSQATSMQMKSVKRRQIERLGRVYLAFCADQPLPLFPRDGFVKSLLGRADATLFAIIANSLRHADDSEDAPYHHKSQIFRDAAYSNVMSDVSHGNVDISTLQTLCLIVLFDFADSQMKTASSLIALTSSLALGVDDWTSAPASGEYVIEERKCCYWSIVLLQRLLGITVPLATTLDVKSLPYPNSCSMPTGAVLRPEVRQAYEQSRGDNGVMVFVIEMSVEWAKVMCYVKDSLSVTPDVSPWLTSSRYTATLAGIMSIETRLQPLHRYKHVTFRGLTLEDLEECRAYWAPWLLSRFLYHTMICLLNHPLLVTLQLQSRGNDSELFREQSSFYVARHVHWILHFIAFIEARSFRITDPILGYCAAVVATIESQLIYSVDETTAEKKRRNIESCRRLIRNLAPSNPSMIELDRKLGALSEIISTTYTSNMSNTASVSVDLSRIRDILNICPFSSSVSDLRPNGQDNAPQDTDPIARSPSHWVRLSRRPSVDQPDEGASPMQDEDHRPHDFMMPPQTLTDPTDPQATLTTEDLTAAIEAPGFPADLFFNGISQDVSSWWNAFETYDPDCPSF